MAAAAAADGIDVAHASGPLAGKQKRRAFTLVELLVVIGIIALLISILMPALNGARRAAREVACLSNIRQLSMALRMYAEAHKGKTFRITHAGADQYWHHHLAPYMGNQRYAESAANADSDESLSMAVMFCPDAQDRNPPSGWVGSRWHAWHWGPSGYGSYGLNLWLIPNYPEYKADVANLPREEHFPNLSTLSKSTEVPTFGDSSWVGSWPHHDDLVPNDPDGWVNQGIPHQRRYFMGRYFVDRHRRAINMGFVDGSARRVGLAELWELRWNRQSVPKKVDVNYTW